MAISDNMGDIRSPAWKVNPGPEVRLFTDADGNPVDRDDPNLTFAALDENGRPFIAVNFACLRCHTEEEDTLEWAANASAIIHP